MSLELIILKKILYILLLFYMAGCSGIKTTKSGLLENESVTKGLEKEADKYPEAESKPEAKHPLEIERVKPVFEVTPIKKEAEPPKKVIIKKPKTKEVFIVATSDLHGRILNHEYGGYDKRKNKDPNDKQAIGGFAKTASFIKDMRKKHPNLILVDLGDAYFYEPFNTKPSPNIVPILNYLNYDLYVLGNHELYLKRSLLEGNVKDFKGSIITNNIYIDEKRYDRTLDYKILDVNGIKIAFTGSTVPQKGIRKLLLSYEYDINDPYIETKRVEKEMSKDYDYFIGLEHLTEGDFEEYSGAKSILEKDNKLDLVLNGHTHQEKKYKVDDKYLIQNSAYGISAISIKITFTQLDGKWVATKVSPKIHYLNEYEADKDFVEKFQDLDKETTEYEANSFKKWEEVYNKLHKYIIP